MDKRKSKLIIAGTRHFTNKAMLYETCDSILNRFKDEIDFEIISGGAKGADSLGEEYAKDNSHQLKIMNADWDKFGKAAGYRRNVDMSNYCLEDCDFSLLIAFWDGKSKGTKHMIDIANTAGIKIKIVKY